jgi:hypothetical protein
MRNLIRNTFDEADDIASQYPLGMTLNVYYNPDKPNEAIWKTEDANKLWWEFVASLLELGVGIFFMYKAFNM